MKKKTGLLPAPARPVLEMGAILTARKIQPFHFAVGDHTIQFARFDGSIFIMDRY